MKSHFAENKWYALPWTRNSITLQSVSWHRVDKFGTQAVKKSSELTNPDKRIQVYIAATLPMKPRNGLSSINLNKLNERSDYTVSDALKRVGERKLMALDSPVRHGRKLQMKLTTLRLGPWDHWTISPTSCAPWFRSGHSSTTDTTEQTIQWSLYWWVASSLLLADYEQDNRLPTVRI
jgi:hypothetical protein